MMDALSSDVPWPKPLKRRLSEDERARRLQELLDNRPDGPSWVFAFGSLMWNPCFEYDRSEQAFLEGWERKFHIWTSLARGTPERPGLGLCLEKGESECKGLVYRLLPEHEEMDWQKLWDREMVSGIYQAVWMDLTLISGEVVSALTFVVDPTHIQYAGGLTIPVMSEIIAGASGRYGRCRDYLASTVEEMAKIGVVDPDLDALLMAVDAHIEQVTD